MNTDMIVQVLVTIGSLATMMWAMLKFLLRDIRTDLHDLKISSMRHEVRIDHLYEENNRLYKVLMEMVKK